jgi:hypothetical protein
VIESTGDRFHRSQLAHASDFELVIKAVFEDAMGSSFSSRPATESALGAFVDMVITYPGETGPVRLFMEAKGLTPAPYLPPEYLPSSLVFDVDQKQGVAAAALLIFDASGISHQWLTLGDRDRDDVALIMDPFNPGFARFPPESLVPAAQLRQAVLDWAFGEELPPTAVPWRRANEDEVGWPVGATY